ncbi:MAG: 30S ribosomal protein S16 [Candidatus Xiphinematobacter sp.]|nr:MAG: 30S ribosomal protein S16 [Candidatus Xiphinematobacter sp.]QQY08056.1 MAG: 30S ribosomal protein S16 [Candidatus Xiphinematobacter sp.]QQY08803.1 MAG: 30S ribosomal protein S16 [Candidatus Xiphinematobacter sp.]QQY09530.1 MAG: 30S ribosomal protein S16 [Candidatus Xiphinematobacter sp.]QQY10287.1 MAG: 30S ribosomal protein S16 [Candidatus Xiphinematobacter sp.]
MAVRIRLKREGARNCPYYKIVVTDQRHPRDGRFIEIVGRYNPRGLEGDFSVELDRVAYWLGVGAQPSQTVHNLIKKEKARGRLQGQASVVV